MSFLDLSVFVFVFLATFFLVRFYQKSSLEFPHYFWGSLAISHYFFSGLAVYYVFKYGGDSFGYWTLTADVSQRAQTWMGHWGCSTFFIQWLNYIPYRIVGLHFFSGVMIYSFLSLLGFFLLAQLAHPLFCQLKIVHRYLSLFFLLAFFLPSLHFWAGLVGKEALICFFLAITLYHSVKDRFLWAFPSSLVLIWIRPVVGILVVAYLLASLFFSDKFSHKWKFGLMILGMLGLGVGFYLLRYLTHLEEMGWAEIQRFREGQYLFLSGFKAGSEIKVEEMNIGEILFAVAFRPFLGEMTSVWGVAAGLENFIVLLISFGIVGNLVKPNLSKRTSILSFTAFVLILIYLFSIALTVNILGVMVRLKSVAMPFLIYFGFKGWDVLLHWINRQVR